MKILHVHSGNMYGGVETALLSFHQGQSFLGSEQHFVLCFTGHFSEQLKGQDAKTFFLNPVHWRFPWTVWMARKKLSRLLDQGEYDVVFFHNCWGVSVFGQTVRNHRSKPRMVFLVHDAIYGKHWLERFAKRVPMDLVIANSQFTKSTIDPVFSVDSRVWYLPIFAPDAQHASDRFYTRQKMNCPDSTFVIIQSCRLLPYKGHEVLFRAVAEWKDHTNWECWIVGSGSEGNYELYLRELCDRLEIQNRVRFLGFRHDISDLLAAADVFCQPNQGEEPFGLSLIEALYAGLPVVTTDLGGLREIVDDSCGALVSPQSPEGVRRSLEKLMTNPAYRKQLSQAGPARARQLCDPKRQLSRLRELLDGLHGRKTSGLAA